MKTLALLLGLIFTFSELFAGNAGIKGKVIRSDNKQPVSGAFIAAEQCLIVAKGAVSSSNGEFFIKGLEPGTYELRVKAIGYQLVFLRNIQLNENEIYEVTVEVKPNNFDKKEDLPVEQDIVVECEESAMDVMSSQNGKGASKKSKLNFSLAAGASAPSGRVMMDRPRIEHNTESYDLINENKFLSANYNPLSTFSIDVDRASYANTRRFLNSNTMPPKDAVRIEELINYFDYDYPQPTHEHPFSFNMEMSDCPWNKKHKLLHVGIKGKELETNNIPASNLVFLLDVSGSMNSPNKLPLLKAAFKVLVDKLRPQDKVAIVVYAGAAGLVLESTPGSNKTKILGALGQLQAGGSTAGGAGIKLAYRVAKENFIRNGNNRIILATDGDFNIGASSDAAMVRLIEDKRDDGIFLTVLGFGMGNYKDSKMEQVSNAGNGNYAYIDNILEAKKMLGKEIWGTLYTIAKDVKIQIEFNPNKIKAYRLIGYENRLLAKEDFNDDTKDAGEIGAGHCVTALYEVIMAGSGEEVSSVDPLKYQSNKIVKSNELLTIKFRYKKPDVDKSILVTKTLKQKDVKNSGVSDNFLFASAVAEFGMMLRDSEYKAQASYGALIKRAKQAKGKDADGYRSDFIKLAEIASLLDSSQM